MIYNFQGYCVSFKHALVVILFFIGIELIHNKSSCSHPFDELLLLYYKRVMSATHSIKFTLFLQNRNRRMEMLTIIIIPPWFQACLYWKKFVSWRHHFQPSIFSMLVSLFRGSALRNPHVKETVFISQHFVEPSVAFSKSSSLSYPFYHLGWYLSSFYRKERLQPSNLSGVI